MRKTRFMSLVFLVLSASFFFVAEFREGIAAGMGPLLHGRSGEGWWIESAGRVPEPALDRLARTAEENSDALTLAFVALQHPREKEQVRLSNLAVNFDSEFTWLYYAMRPHSRPDQVAEAWVRKLQQWDPDNAVPYLAEAVWRFNRNQYFRYRGIHGSVLETLSEAGDWRAPMEKAFAAPRYDAYHYQLFNVVRGAMRRHDLQKPAILLRLMSHAPIASLLNNMSYANVVVFKYGKEAEAAGRLPQAVEQYRSVVRFGERMQAHANSLVEKLIGQSLTKTAAQRLLPLLRRTNRAGEALELETRIAGFKQGYAYLTPLGQSSHNLWNAMLVVLLSALVLIFAVYALVSAAYTNAKRWMRTQVRGRIFEFLTVSENYAPILLFMACLGLYLVYYPYAVNFRHYMTVTEAIYDFEPLFWNTLPTVMWLPWSAPALDFGNPFDPYLWVALIGLALAIAYIVYERKLAARPVKPDLGPKVPLRE